MAIELGMASTTSNTVQTLALLQAPINSGTRPIDSAQIVLEGQALMNERRPSNEPDIAATGGDQISVYVVRPGDTLSGIADMFGVSQNTIRWANDIPSKGSIQPDQELIILPISGLKYTIKKGDTLKGIATSFNGDQDEILTFNDLISFSELKVGDEIIIPNGEMGISHSQTPSGSKASSGGSASASSGSTSSSGYLTRPVKGGVRTQGVHGHNGVDIASSLNTPIYAAAAGKVLIAKQGGWNGGYGSYVVISHSNGMQTLYAHLNTVSVSAGQTVSQGQSVGGMGTTGDSSGVHLHFEVRGGKNPF